MFICMITFTMTKVDRVVVVLLWRYDCLYVGYYCVGLVAIGHAC